MDLIHWRSSKRPVTKNTKITTTTSSKRPVTKSNNNDKN
jgi:hypothetical protein